MDDGRLCLLGSLAAALLLSGCGGGLGPADAGEDAEADGDADGDAEPDGEADGRADGDQDEGPGQPFVLHSPRDRDRFYVGQPVAFAGISPGPLEVVVEGWTIGGAEAAGPFAFEHAFSNAGERPVSFLVDGLEALAIVLVVEPPRGRVCIDPGHPSSPGDKLFEALINRKVAFYLEDMLLAEGFEVLIVVDDLTREELFAEGFDNEGAEEQSWLEVLGLEARAAACNRWPADWFLSIHHNAVDNPAPNYALVLYGESSVGRPRFAEAVDWAAATTDQLTFAMEVTGGRTEGDRSFLGFGLYMLQNTEMVGVLTEGSFYSNPAERARLNEDDYLLGEAGAIFDGFVAFVEG